MIKKYIIVVNDSLAPYFMGFSGKYAMFTDVKENARRMYTPEVLESVERIMADWSTDKITIKEVVE